MQINSYAGVPLDKIVIGKPNDQGAADNGYMDPSDLATCVSQAQKQGWNGGVMFWEWAGVSALPPDQAKLIMRRTTKAFSRTSSPFSRFSPSIRLILGLCITTLIRPYDLRTTL